MFEGHRKVVNCEIFDVIKFVHENPLDILVYAKHNYEIVRNCSLHVAT